MTQREQFKDGLFLLAWGYFLISFNLSFNFGGFTLPLLPNILGWYLFYRGICLLKEQCSELSLLENFCYLLLLSSLDQFIPSLLEHIPGMGYFSMVTGVVLIYFHFQLLTNVAELASTHNLIPYQEALLSLRTQMVICLTVNCLWKLLPQDWLMIMVIPLVYYLIVVICIIYQLYMIQKELAPDTTATT